MSEKVLNDEDGRPYTGQDVLYREKGVSAYDVQHAADALLRLGKKPSIAAIREHLGGGSPNTLAPLLEKYWKGLGTRLPSGPDSLERVPESLARMTEALWLRSLDEARERAKAALIGASPTQREVAVVERKLSEASAALAEARARASELEAQLLASLRDRMELRETVQQLTVLLKAEQELRVQERESSESRRRETETSRTEIIALARRKLLFRGERKTSVSAAKRAAKVGPTGTKFSARIGAAEKRPKSDKRPHARRAHRESRAPRGRTRKQ
jgi:hypothetical protein